MFYTVVVSFLSLFLVFCNNISFELPKGTPFQFNVYFILRLYASHCLFASLHNCTLVSERIPFFALVLVHCIAVHMGTMFALFVLHGCNVELPFFLLLPVIFVSLIFNYMLDICD